MTDVSERIVCLTIRGASLTAQALSRCILRYLASCKKQKSEHPGEVSLKKLTKDGSKLESCPIAAKSLRGFDRVARKYGVQYAARKVINPNEPDVPEYSVFFKCGRTAQMHEAMREYSHKVLGKSMDKERSAEQQPSLRDTLNKNQVLAKQQSAPQALDHALQRGAPEPSLQLEIAR